LTVEPAAAEEEEDNNDVDDDDDLVYSFPFLGLYFSRNPPHSQRSWPLNRTETVC
jgi:hypothetical protein